MYQQTWVPSPQVYRSGGLFAVYPYLPWTSVLLAPFRLALGDIRYGEIVALAVTAVTLRSVAGEHVRRGADPTLARRLGLQRQWLHAMRLGFEHPETGDYVTYESTYPDDLAHALEVIREAH